jgi:DNA-binding CsgD family transcriptional regulator
VITNHFSLEYAATLSRVTNSYIFVAERRKGYPFISQNIGIFGLDIPEDGRSPDPAFVKGCIHPDDLDAFNELMIQMYDQYLPDLPREEQMEYIQVFEFRAKAPCRGEGWVRITTRMQILDFNAEGDPIQLAVVDISPDQTPQAEVRATLTNAKTGEIIPFTIDRPAESELSKREAEILSLIGIGMYSKEISDRLSISINTVNNHRQNILKKMNVSNMPEAVKKFTLSL